MYLNQTNYVLGFQNVILKHWTMETFETFDFKETNILFIHLYKLVYLKKIYLARGTNIVICNHVSFYVL